MKKLNLRLDGIKEMLSREQMKKINGGYDGNRCVYFCCDNYGNCTERGASVTQECTSNEDCQSNSEGVSCTIGYVAALCKS